MRNHRARSFTLLALLLLPATAQAALTPVGAPLAITDESPCSFDTDLEVTATPKGAFEVVWVDDWNFEVRGRRFDRGLNPGGPPVALLPLHGGLFIEPLGTWAAGRYELVLNAADFSANPSDPAAAYRLSLDLDGQRLAVRLKPRRFIELAPAANGDSLQFRFEPPYFGPPNCRSIGGLLASRVDTDGTPLSGESRVTRQASAWTSFYLAVDRRQDDTFIAAYETCQKFVGLVARRLSSTGAPVGKPINLPFPGRIGNFGNGDNLVLAARGGINLAVGLMINDTVNTEISGLYTRAVANGQLFGPTRVAIPPGVGGVSGVEDLEDSPDGRYLLLFYGSSTGRNVLFAQELNAQGVPQGTALQVTGDGEFARNGAVASLPDGRWIVVTRAQHTEAEVCTERLIGTVLSSD